MANPRPLGTPYTVKPTEFGHDATLTLTRIFEDDDFYSEFFNAGPEPTTGKGTDRVLVKVFSATDPTDYLEIDIPKAQFVSTITRQEGHFVENITLRAQQSTDADGCVDTALPLYRIGFENSDTTDYAAAL